MNDVLGHKHGVVGPPRLHALGIEGESCRNLVEFLNHEVELERRAVEAFHVAVPFRDVFLEVLKEIFPDDIHDLSESGLHGVIDRIVDDCLAVRAESVHLLKSAVTAAHSGCKYKKCRFHNNFFY